MAREDPHFRLRFPDDLREKVEVSAKENRRSMTAEILARIESSFMPPEPAVELPGTNDLIATLTAQLADTKRQAELFEAAARLNIAIVKMAAKSDPALQEALDEVSVVLGEDEDDPLAFMRAAKATDDPVPAAGGGSGLRGHRHGGPRGMNFPGAMNKK